MVLVEEHRQQTGVGLRGVRALVSLGSFVTRAILGGEALLDPDESRFVDRLSRAVFRELEVGGFQSVDESAAGVGGDDVHTNRARSRRGCRPDGGRRLRDRIEA